MNTLRADLHTHTHYSDGQLAPAQLVRKARERGLQALAVTDHDTLDGWEEARRAGQACGVDVIPGVELSVTVGEQEVHLLGYLFDPDHAGLRAHLEGFKQARYERARAMVERLNALDMPLRFEAVLAQVKDGSALGRPHVAAALAAEGYVDASQDAFDAYIGDGRPACVAKPHFPAAEALGLLHAAGGIGVLAHPGHWTSDRLLQALIRAGLDGIEVVHPAHDGTLTRYYHRLAQDFFLVETGGSDYHGHRAQDEENLGTYTIPYERLKRLRRAAA